MQKLPVLSARLSIIVLIISAAIFFSVVAIILGISRSYILKHVVRDAERVSALAIIEIENSLKSVRQPIMFLSEYMNQNPSDTATLFRSLQRLSASDNRIASSFCHLSSSDSNFNNYDGRLFLFTEGHTMKLPEDTDILQFRQWQRQLKAFGKPYWSAPYYKKSSGDQMVAYIVPLVVKNAKGEAIKSFMGFEFRLNWLTTVVASKKVYDSDYMLILSDEGMPMVAPIAFGQGIDIFQIARQLNNPEILEVASKMMAGQKGSLEVKSLFTDKSALVYYAPVSASNWSLAIVFPKHEIFRNLYILAAILGVLVVVSSIVIFLAVSAIAKRFTKPVQEFAAAAGEICRGNFEATISSETYYHEVALLKDSLATMQDDFQAYNRNLVKGLSVRERTDSENTIAREILMGVLHNDFDPINKSGLIDIAARIVAANEISGDFYDHFRIDQSHFCFAIGTVSARGVEAAKEVLRTLTLLRSGNYHQDHLKTTVAQLNQALIKTNEKPVHVKLFIAIADIQTGDLVFCNAGFNYPYLLKENTLYEMKTDHGTALGISATETYKTARIKLEPGDRMVAYSVGVTSTINETGNSFGKERVEVYLNENINEWVKNLNSGLLNSALRFSGKSPLKFDLAAFTIGFKVKSNNEN